MNENEGHFTERLVVITGKFNCLYRLKSVILVKKSFTDDK